jgi:hypothetical protein
MNSALRTFVLGGVLGAGIVTGGALAFAQETGTTVPPATSGTTPGTAPAGPGTPAPDDKGACDPGDKGRGGKEGGKAGGFHLGANAEALATELGVTTDQLKAAEQAGREAVKALPDIDKPATKPPTQEEKDKLAADLKARAELYTKTVAEKLGVTPDRLKEARKAVVKKDLDAAVAAGKLTQEQADKLLAKVDEGGEGFGLGGPGKVGPGGPGHRGRGGAGGGEKAPGGS